MGGTRVETPRYRRLDGTDLSRRESQVKRHTRTPAMMSTGSARKTGSSGSKMSSSSSKESAWLRKSSSPRGSRSMKSWICEARCVPRTRGEWMEMGKGKSCERGGGRGSGAANQREKESGVRAAWRDNTGQFGSHEGC